jgi:hypothetical protein
MKKMLVSGASWTSGWPLEERLGHRELVWPNLVANHFEFELIDKSRSGSSNYRIYRKAFDEILLGVDLAIVFWTSWERFETGANYGDKPGRIYQHLLNKVDQKTFRLFFNGYLQYTDWIRQTISLQYLSTVTNTPCFFIANLDAKNILLFKQLELENFKDILRYNPIVFDNIDDHRIEEKFQKVKLLESKIDWSKFISSESYLTLGKDFTLNEGHPSNESHNIIAEMIIKFLNQHYQVGS